MHSLAVYIVLAAPVEEAATGIGERKSVSLQGSIQVILFFFPLSLYSIHIWINIYIFFLVETNLDN